MHFVGYCIISFNLMPGNEYLEQVYCVICVI